MILPSFPSTGVTLSCFQPFTLHLTDSSLHRLVLRFVLRPDNIDSWAELLNPQNLSYFSCFFLPTVYTSPCTVSARQLSFFLNPTVFTLLTIIQFCSPPLSSPLRGSGIRGIPEGDFPCFRLSVWPLKTVYC